MNLPLLLIGLAFLGAIFFGIAGALVAAIFKKWAVARGILLTAGAMAALIWFYCSATDPFARGAADMTKLPGDYSVDRNSSQAYLERLGYKAFTGRITLKSQGEF